eukprot:10862737-Prorocentrum_lima.AAC.1
METRLWRLLWIKDLWLFAATTWAPGQTPVDFDRSRQFRERLWALRRGNWASLIDGVHACRTVRVSQCFATAATQTSQQRWADL